MYLYLIRHAIALDLDTNGLSSVEAIARDELRPLTKVGRKKMSQVADRIHKSGLNFDLIMTSPLVRARQTADIAIEHQLGTKLELSEDLKPAGNLHDWLATWESKMTETPLKTVALVGHEPNLSEWAELLIFGNIHHKLILKKGGIIGLKFSSSEIAIGTAQLYCSIPPKYSCSDE
jgi:phosphohistidine phosphatase